MTSKRKKLRLPVCFQVEFKYRPGQPVYITALELEGVVMACCFRSGGSKDYRVIYWADGKRNDEWLYEFELIRLHYIIM